MQPRRKVARVDDKAQYYVFLGKKDAQASDAVSTVLFLLVTGWLM